MIKCQLCCLCSVFWCIYVFHTFFFLSFGIMIMSQTLVKSLPEVSLTWVLAFSLDYNSQESTFLDWLLHTCPTSFRLFKPCVSIDSLQSLVSSGFNLWVFFPCLTLLWITLYEFLLPAYHSVCLDYLYSFHLVLNYEM